MASSSNTYVFSAIQTEEIINYMQEYECLWKLSDKDYKNVLLKNQITNSIGRIMGVSGEQVLKKVRSLRDQFIREERRRKGIIAKSGSEADLSGGYRAYNQLLFMRDKRDVNDIPTDSNYELQSSQEAKKDDATKEVDAINEVYAINEAAARKETPDRQLATVNVNSSSAEAAEAPLIRIGVNYYKQHTTAEGQLILVPSLNVSNTSTVEKDCGNENDPGLMNVLSIAKNFASDVHADQHNKLQHMKAVETITNVEDDGEDVYIVDTGDQASNFQVVLKNTRIAPKANLLAPQLTFFAPKPNPLAPKPENAAAKDVLTPQRGATTSKLPILAKKQPTKKRKFDSDIQDSLPSLVETANKLVTRLVDGPAPTTAPDNRKVEDITSNIHPFFIDVSQAYVKLPDHLQDDFKIEVMQMLVAFKKRAREESFSFL